MKRFHGESKRDSGSDSESKEDERVSKDIYQQVDDIDVESDVESEAEKAESHNSCSHESRTSPSRNEHEYFKEVFDKTLETCQNST